MVDFGQLLVGFGHSCDWLLSNYLIAVGTIFGQFLNNIQLKTCCPIFMLSIQSIKYRSKTGHNFPSHSSVPNKCPNAIITYQ